MRLFTDHKLPKETTIGIDGLIGTLTQKTTSHKGAWPRIVQNMLLHLGYNNVHILDKTAKWDEYEAIIMDLGMEFKGTFNLFGGASDELALRLTQFANYDGKLFSYDKEFPDVCELIDKRLNTGTDAFKDLVQYKGLIKSQVVHVIDHIYQSSNVIVGDSHCISQYGPGYMIYRHDGQTLHGFLNKDPHEFMHLDDSIRSIKLYFGNIDIRHHLMRQEDPVEAINELLEAYFTRIKCLMGVHNISKVRIVSVLPIESESRKLPKTGYYKGTPFTGSQTERSILSSCFNEGLLYFAEKTPGVSVVLHPTHFLLEDEEGNQIKELDMEVMEKPKSVHISPEHYLWDLTGNKLNNYNGLVTKQLELV